MSETKKMSGFEEYQKKQDTEKHKEEFYTGQIDKGVDVNKASYDYDPDQLIEHLKKKTDDKSAEAFALRTKYYFQDDQAITAKIRRYQKINQRGEYQDKVDVYAERYNHHSAKHRKWAAETASIKFMDAQNLALKYKNDENANSLVKYRHRKEIMNQRMEALERVAYVKAQSKKHEKYLNGRSKLSCNLILKDQLDHFIDEESRKQNNDDMVNSLKAELTKVEAEITKATKTIRENVSKSHEKWRDVNGINDRKYTHNMNTYRQEECIGCSKNSAILMTELELFNSEQRGYEWPRKSVLKDQDGLGAPLSQAEKENQEWNTKYDSANANEKFKMEVEALKRFLEMPVPSAEAIKGSKAKNYIITNLRDYYDLTKRALPYYKNLLKDTNNPLTQIIAGNLAIQAKIEYIAAIDKYIDYRLRRDHLIVYDSETGQYSFEQEEQYKYTRGFFGPKRTRKYGDDENGKSESADRFTALKNAFDTYHAAPAISTESLNNISQNLNINIQPQNIINEPLNIINEPQNIVIQPQVIEENQIDKNGKEEINKANNLVKNMINLFDNKGKKIEQNQEDKKEDNIIINEEDKKEEQKQEKKENKLQNRINIFEKKEEKKEDKKEEIKEDKKEEIIEEKKEEKNKKKAVKNENKISENKIIENKINENVINESFANPHFISENMVDSYKRKNPELSDKAVKILKAKRNMIAMNDCPEYKKLMKKTGKELKGDIAKASIDRVAAYVMRPVIFDENYKPVNTKENIANHEWNIKWLKAWEDNAPLTEGDLKAKKAKETKKNISRIKLTKQEIADMEKENKKRRQRQKENEKIRKQMINEEASKMFEGFNLPPIPKSENLTGNELAEYRSELDKWIEEQMEKDPERYYLLKVKLTAMNSLAKQSKDLGRVYMKDSARKNLEVFMAGLDSYVSFYLISKYHIEVAHKGEDAVLTPKEAETRGKNYEGMLEDMAKSVAMTAIPYKKALESKKLKLVDINELRQAHEGNAIITDTQGELELKKEIAEDIKDKVNAVNTEKISLRRRVDIEDKKRLDFKTFEKLSAFGTLFENKGDLSKYCALYGLGLKKQKANKKEDDGSKEIKEVMEKLTDVVWKFDLRDINLSSDEHLMLHTAELEKMSQAVEAYKDLLFANPEYLKKLKQDNAIDEKAFPDRAEEMIDHVVKLTAVTDYYRARKLVLTDELYTSKLNSQISYQSEKGDGIQMRRFKKMLRASYIAALNMNRAFGGKIPKELSVKAESEEEEAAIKNLFRDPVTVKEEKEERIRIEQERLKKEEEERKRKEKELEERRKKGEIIDEKKEAEKRKEEEKKKEEERKKKKDIHALDINVNIKDSLLEKLDALTVRDKELKRLENEKLFQAPLWMQNAFTLDPAKIPTALKTEGVKNPFFAIDNDKFAQARLNLYLEDPEVKSLTDKREAVIKELTGGISFLGAPKFKSEGEDYLGKLEVSDNWNRTKPNFAKEYMYGKCEEEMVELTELMKIQESKEWVDEKGVKHSKNWDDIAKDKEAVAFYKSAYTELAMKLIFSIYATGKRVAETYALKALILHPTDFLMQLTYQIRQNISSSAVISNIIGKRQANSSGTNQERVKLLFDKNDDGTYNIDMEDILNTTGVMTSIGFKINATTQGIVETATKQNIEDDENEDEVAAAEGKSKKIFGKKEFFKKIVKPEFEAYQKEHPPIKGMVDGLFYTHDDNFIMAWYFNRHPEYINKKALMSKYDGETVLETVFADAYNSPFTDNEYDIAQCMKKKNIDIPSDEELNNYEKHLVEEKYSILRPQYDPCNNLRMNPKEKIPVVDENNTVIGKETNKLILDARKKDPYGINLFRTQFSELEYVDKEGNKHFRKGI